MGSVQFGIPRELALALKAKHGMKYFIETGTLVGHTSEWAAGYFDHVTTIDNNPNPEAFTRLKDRRNVSPIIFDSAETLRAITPSEPCLYWLDAHTNESCPVLDEIAALNKSDLRHVILVDDARLFGGQPESLPAWPALYDVCMELIDGGRRTVQIIDDVIVAEPCP